MTRNIYLIDDAGSLKAMTEQRYESELLLQDMLEQFPEIMGGEQFGSESESRRWLLVSREVEVPGEEGGSGRWYLDHLFLDQDGVPTLVEVKRSTDTRIRREVVGQMLDYAANAVVYWPLETIRAKFEAVHASEGEDYAQLIGDLVGESSGEGDPIEEFWSRVSTNLRAGRIRMIFVADEIPPELRRIVEFLNGQMSPAEVSAIEIRQFVGQGIKTLVPTVVGQTVAAEQAKGNRELSETKKMQLEFWKNFKNYLESDTKIQCRNPQPQYWMYHPIRRAGFQLDSVFSTYDSKSESYAQGELRVELFWNHKDAEKCFKLLGDQRSEIESELGDSLEWVQATSGQSYRIYVQKSVDITARDNWPDYYLWLREKLEAFYRVVEPRILALKV